MPFVEVDGLAFWVGSVLLSDPLLLIVGLISFWDSDILDMSGKGTPLDIEVIFISECWGVPVVVVSENLVEDVVGLGDHGLDLVFNVVAVVE